MPGANPATWQASFASWTESGAVEALSIDGAFPGSSRHAYRLGTPGAREHAWVICDGDATGGVRAAWAVIEALAGTRLSRFRQLLLGRARVTVVLPDPAAPPLRAGLPVLDAQSPAVEVGVLAAFEIDPPTIVLHAQDFGDPARRGSSASGRVVESFPIAIDLHRSLGEGILKRRNWRGARTTQARAIADHPDARIGAAAAAAAIKSGHVLRDVPTGILRRDAPGTVRIAPGRYVPTMAWRRLGASCLVEVAHARFGVHGVTIQAFEGSTSGRTGTILAIAEGTLLARLRLSED